MAVKNPTVIVLTMLWMVGLARELMIRHLRAAAPRDEVNAGPPGTRPLRLWSGGDPLGGDARGVTPNRLRIVIVTLRCPARAW